jgi:cobalt/nickel transport system ATP-binding protein
MSEPLITLEKVCFDYPDRPVFTAVDFHLAVGERVALVGPNGAGKSTLLQLIVGLHRPKSGRVIAFGRQRRTEQDFDEVRTRAGLLFQDSDDQLFCPTVLEDVAFGPMNLGKPPEEAVIVATQTLASLGLEALADRVTHRLSGGEKRLVSLATVLSMQPEVLLLDEPTTGLDEATEQRLLAHLQQLPMAMVFVSHDRRIVERLATRAVLLRNGALVDGVIHSHAHVHAHTHAHIHPADATHALTESTPPHPDHHLK